MRFLILAVALVAGFAALHLIRSGPGPAPEPVAQTSSSPGDAALRTVVTVEPRYFFDVSGHTEAEVRELLRRAQEIYAQTPPEQRAALEIALILHGPDIRFFARRNYDAHRGLVDLAAELERLGYIDFKACAVTVREHGFEDDEFPAFIELVPYALNEISRLENAGYVKL